MVKAECTHYARMNDELQGRCVMAEFRGFKRTVALAGLISCTTGAVAAAESGPYVAVDLGWAFSPQDVAWRISPVTELTGSGLHDHDVAWALSAGYRFNRYLGLEAGFLDLGQLKGLVSDHSGATNAQAELSSSHKGETLALVGILPFGNWEAYMKAGVLFADTQIRANGAADAVTIEGTVSSRTTHSLVGAGLGYKLDAHWRAQIGLTGYYDVGSASGNGISINGPTVRLLTAGISYRF
jgi:OmpA-like transmembrane domain